jgi:peptidyl-prolyl cis-trans isomerase SDCCAG10
MSSIEPQTTAKVVLHTTKGPLEIELWAEQTPLACRNFIQLCANGYYDNCAFHRVVKDYIIQSGDPSGTGYGGVPIYDEGSFRDEFHSRLRFNRRGLVGCANTGEPNSNGSQFIITLSPTPELNNKNTLFGRIVGDTIFNVLRIGESEVGDDEERPLYPTVIIRAEIVTPYFNDLKFAKQNKQDNSSLAVESEKTRVSKRKKPIK